MMRLPRKASLLVAFCLLTSAESAYAECAWVLWSGPRLDAHHALGAWQTKEQCEASAEYRAAQKAASAAATATGMAQAFTVCLPDTIDPRGPKGK